VLARVARSAGWKVGRTANGATKDKAAAMLASLSPEDRAALLQQYAPPAPEKHKKGSK
jgi:hypothetical protein